MGLTREDAQRLGLRVEEPRVRADLLDAMEAARQRRGGARPESDVQRRAPLDAEERRAFTAMLLGTSEMPPPAERDDRVANLGQEWERVLKVQHDVYRRDRTADVEKIPTPVTQLGPGFLDEQKRPVFRAMRTAQSTTDFVGLLVAGRFPGRCCRLEAKSARHDRIELHGKTGVQEHQAAALRRALLGGGFAAVLVLIPSGMFIVPWVNWRAPASSPERKSLNVQGLDAAGERFGSSQQARRVLLGLPTPADWLAAALRMEWV